MKKEKKGKERRKRERRRSERRKDRKERFTGNERRGFAIMRRITSRRNDWKTEGFNDDTENLDLDSGDVAN